MGLKLLLGIFVCLAAAQCDAHLNEADDLEDFQQLLKLIHKPRVPERHKSAGKQVSEIYRLMILTSDRLLKGDVGVLVCCVERLSVGYQ